MDCESAINIYIRVNNHIHQLFPMMKKKEPEELHVCKYHI